MTRKERREERERIEAAMLKARREFNRKVRVRVARRLSDVRLGTVFPDWCYEARCTA